MKKIFNKYFALELFIIILFIFISLIFRNNIFISSILLVLTSTFVFFIIRKKRIVDVVNKKSINIIMLVFGVLYISLFYMIGLYTHFYNNLYSLSINSIIHYIIPITIIVICVEFIRNKLLNNDGIVNMFLILMITTIPDFIIYSQMYNSIDLDKFLVLIGYILFASISNSLLFNYISSRYGPKPIVIYRLITILYAYILPIIPNVYMFFRTFVRIFYPILIYYYIDKYYDTDKKVIKIKDRRYEVISMSFCTILMLGLIALVSCKFDYGALVIGSASMAGSIDKGDVIIYKTGNNVKLNDVIVFKKNNLRIVHRIVKIDDNGLDKRFYTKGDANDIKDKDFITNKDVVGKVVFNIKQIGKPTLWLRDIFNKEG